MKVKFTKKAEDDYTVYYMSPDGTLTEIGTIVKHKRAYLFNDQLFHEWWSDTSIAGLMEEVKKYYS